MELVDRPLTAGPVVGMQTRRMRGRNPPQEVAHASVFRGLQHKLPAIGHTLVGQNPAGVPLQSLGEDLQESIGVLRFIKNGRPRISSGQGVLNPIRFVCKAWANALTCPLIWTTFQLSRPAPFLQGCGASRFNPVTKLLPFAFGLDRREITEVSKPRGMLAKPGGNDQL